MARTKNQGPCVGNYVTLRLIARAALGAGQSSTILDRIPMPLGFRVCQVEFSALGITANATGAVTDSGGVSGTGTIDVDAAATNVVSALTLATNGFRDVPQGNALELRGTTDGTGAIPAGGLVAFVTGYFTDHIAHSGRFIESGQCAYSGPRSGHYDWITLSNLRQSANQAARSECDMIVPYDCRVMALVFHVVGQTEGTGTIVCTIRKNDVSFIGSGIDIDAMGSDTTNGDAARLDAQTSTPLGAGREFSRGDKLSMYIATGASDVLPVGALSCHVLVWVKGHVNFAGVVGSSQYGNLDNPSAVTGPALGGMIVVPFMNKRAAQAAIRTEDSLFLPCDLRLVAASFSKQTSTSTARLLALGSQTITINAATQNYILHNEGTNLGSFTGNVVAVGVPAGEDAALRNLAYAQTFTFRHTNVGDAAFASTAHAFCAVRSHVGGQDSDPALMD